MAFENGLALSKSDFMNKFMNFITNLGTGSPFQTVYNAPDGVNKMIIFSYTDPSNNQTVYFSWQIFEDNTDPELQTFLAHNVGYGYDTTQNIFNQPNSAYQYGGVNTDNINDIYVAKISLPVNQQFEYWFFSDNANYIYVVCKIDGLYYQHLGLGKLISIDSYNPIYFTCGSIYVNYKYDTAYTLQFDYISNLISPTNTSNGGWFMEYDGLNYNFGTMQYSRTLGTAVYDSDIINSHFSLYFEDSATIYDTNVPFKFWIDKLFYPFGVYVPVFISPVFYRVKDNFQPVGYAKDIYATSIDGIQPDTQITIGADTYILFPRYSANLNNYYLTNIGIAIKKII